MLTGSPRTWHQRWMKCSAGDSPDTECGKRTMYRPKGTEEAVSDALWFPIEASPPPEKDVSDVEIVSPASPQPPAV